jgi:endoglucanase
MRKESLDFLSELIAAPSPSGYEQPAQRVWREYMAPFADQVKTDLHGNCIASKNEGEGPRLLLAGHVDELGFMVNYINDDGYISFATIGGFDVGIIPGRRVKIYSENGPVTGVIGKKAIHLMTSEERKKIPKIHELWIDIGVDSKAEAEELVAIGDPATYAVGLEQLNGDLYMARAFDDKAGSFAVGEVLRLLEDESFDPAVYSVSTVQEEVGLRGARTSAFGVNPQVGVAVDVCHATDSPDMDKRKAGDISLGAGPVISRGPNFNPVVVDMLIEAAKEADIPYQMQGAPRGTGTDANAIQLTRAGVATGLVSIPLRYMHTAVEVLSLEDLANVSKLLAAFIRKVKADTDFTP